MSASGGLEEWAERFGGRRPGFPPSGRLRFAFYGRVSTEDWQDPVTSRARQREQAEALVRGHGVIVAEFFDVGQSRSVAWGRRLQAAALVAQLADPGRGWDAIVVGEYERAFYGSQYALMAPLFEHYGVQLWTPEAGGRVDFASEHDEHVMTVLGLSSKREVTRTSIRVADPADLSLGHKQVQRWNLPDGWVISARPAHQALVSEDDYIAAQEISAARGPSPRDDVSAPRKRRYLLAGLLVCGTCGRRMESAWSNGRAAYRCRHGHTSATPPGLGRPRNAYVREDRVLAQLPALHMLLRGAPLAEERRRRTRRGADARRPASPEETLSYLRENEITLTYDQAAGSLRAGGATETITTKAS